MLDDIYQLPLNKVSAIEWLGDPLYYDLQLYELGRGHREFWAINPNSDIPNKWNTDLKYYLDEIPHSRKCIVIAHDGEWIVKLFKDGWYPYHGYETIEIIKPKLAWSKNPDIDKLMTFEDDPFGTFDPDRWDRDYKLIWYMDPRFNPLDDKVWAMSCQPIGRKVLGTKDMGYVVPNVLVQFNEHLPDVGVDANDCCPSFYDLAYECAYELDPIHQTNDERLWVVKFTPQWRKPKEWKWIGTISPEYTVVYNPDLPELDYDLDYVIPWHDFKFEHVWMLDRKHLIHDQDDIWAFTIQVSTELEGSKIVDTISPTLHTIYNPDLNGYKYNIDYLIPYHDFAYTHMLMLDKAYSGEYDIWAVKFGFVSDSDEIKNMGSVSPIVRVVKNPALAHIDVNVEYQIPYHDRHYKHVWYLDQTDTKDKVWALRMAATTSSRGEKDMGTITPLLPMRLDVIFISYHEPNAEENWARVLEKAPYAKRVDGVKGIFEAHKVAATLSTTDMVYVVDGDAWLVDDWEFDFQPGIFDRDCAYVWSSINPVNDLTYQNGGVKLLSKQVLMKQKKWTTLDMFTGIMPKIKAEDTISCITRFNVDKFTTWRSAFRECVKLYTTNQMSKLNAWLKSDVNKPYGEYAALGAKLAYQYAKENKDNHTALLNINNYSWLEQQFKKMTNDKEKT